MFSKWEDDARAAIPQPVSNRGGVKHIEPSLRGYDHGIPRLSRRNFIRQLDRELVASRLRWYLFDREFGEAQLKVNRPTKWVLIILTILYFYSTPGVALYGRVGSLVPPGSQQSECDFSFVVRRTQLGLCYTIFSQVSLRVVVAASVLLPKWTYCAQLLLKSLSLRLDSSDP